MTEVVTQVMGEVAHDNLADKYLEEDVKVAANEEEDGVTHDDNEEEADNQEEAEEEMDKDEKAPQDKEEAAGEEPEKEETPDVNGVEQHGGDDKEEEGETKVNGKDQEKTEKEEEEGDEDHTDNPNISDVVLRQEVRSISQIETAVCSDALWDGGFLCKLLINIHISYE